jgi:hypothetical protein
MKECNMDRDYEQRELVDLGSASEQTLGGEGYSADLVREIPKTGISDD